MSRAEVQRLITLIYVARHGSLTGAAASLGITTSAVSQQISALEADCATPIVERTATGTVLTGAGLSLLEHAEKLARQLDDARSTIAQLSGELAGRVRVATIASGAAALLLPAEKVLEQTAPGVALSVVEREPGESLDEVDGGSVDLALIDVYDHVPVAMPSHLLVEEVLTEPLVLVSACDADLPRRVALASLKDQPWVMPPSTTACGAATRHACRAAGFEPDVAWETDDLLLLVATVSRGAGITLLPRRAVADTVAPVEMQRLVDPVLSRRLLLVARRTTSQRPTVRAVLDAIHHVGRLSPAPSTVR